jgi:hypothetical protein
MFDRATAYNLGRLSGLLQSDDAGTRAAARTAIEEILARQDVTWDAFLDWMSATARPWIDAALRYGLSDLAAPPDIRPGGIWHPIPEGGSLGFGTMFKNGVIARVGPDPRTPAGSALWLGVIDGHLVRQHGQPAQFHSAQEAVDMIERIAQRLFQDPTWRVVIDPAGEP